MSGSTRPPRPLPPVPCIARFEGAIGVKAAAMSVREKPHLALKQKNIMGVVVPEIEATKVQKNLAENSPIVAMACSAPLRSLMRL